MSQVWQDDRADNLNAHHEDVDGSEEDVPEQAEHSGLLHLAKVHPGYSGEGQDGHEHLRGLADLPFGRVTRASHGGWLIWTAMNSSPATRRIGRPRA